MATALAAAWSASQFARDSPCHADETTSACHGRRVAEADPLVLLPIFLAWVAVAFVLPRLYFSRR